MPTQMQNERGEWVSATPMSKPTRWQLFMDAWVPTPRLIRWLKLSK